MPVPISLPSWETLAPMLLPVVEEDEVDGRMEDPLPLDVVVSFFSTVFFSMVVK